MFSRKTRPLRWTAFFAGVALSVFLWGLQYKLSLYDPPQASSHQMPAAKLLKGKEQIAANPSTLVRGGEEGGTATRIWLAAFSVVVALTLDLAAGLWFIHRRRAVASATHLRLEASFISPHFFRPPPVLF